MIDLKHLNWTPCTFKLDMVDLKPLNWAPWTMIFHMTYLESHKLDTLDPKIEHCIVEAFQLDIPNLQIGHGKLETFK